MATDAGGLTTLAKSELDAQGFPITAGSARFIPFIDGDYDLWLFPTEAEADANDTSNAIQLADNLNADPDSTGQLALWDTNVTYNIPEITRGSDNEYYRSLIDSNSGNNPTSSAVQWELLKFGRIWNTNITYGQGDSSYGSDGALYLSRVASNTGNDPISSPTQWASATIGAVVDSNYNEVFDYSGVASAINYIRAINAITDGSPIFRTIGEVDIGMLFQNSDSENMLELIAVAAGANNVRITNAVTTAAAKIDCSETNSDLDFPRNGTGEVTVDSTPIYGLVYLNTPVLLATDTSTTATGNTPVDLSAHGSITGTAVKAILNVFIDGVSGGTGDSEVVVGEGGETLTTLVHRAIYAKGATGSRHDGSNQITINLASGEIFDYAILQTGTAPSSRTVKIYLAGYYI